MSEKVVIPKWLAFEIECSRGNLISMQIKEASSSELNQEIMLDVLKKISASKEVEITVLAKAIEKGYEVGKEYLTLEQVMEFPNGTIVHHEEYDRPMVVCFNQLEFLNGKQKLFYKNMLEPKWYIVEEETA